MRRLWVVLPLLLLATPLRAETILYDFYADWCGPCRAMAPVVSRLEARGIPVRKVNVDRQPELARRFRIQYLPTFVAVADGVEVARHVGPATESELLALLRQATPRPASEKRSGTPRKAPASPNKLLSWSVRMYREQGGARYYGSGTIIYCDGHYALALTCAHLFSSSRGLRQGVKVEWFGEEPPVVYEGTLVARDRASDLAIVRFPVDRQLPVARIAGPDLKLRPGTRLYSVGCDHGSRPRVYPTYLTAVNRYQGPPNFEIAGAPRQGRSGGGLFTETGELVGVCSAADPFGNRGLFTALGAVHHLLAAADLEHLYLPSRPEQPAEPGPARPPIQFASNDRGAVEEPLALPDPDELGLIPGQPKRTAEEPPQPVGSALAAAASTNEPGEAEIVCVIRPLGGVNQPSRVIVLRRATPELVRLLEEHARKAATGVASTSRSAFSPAVEIDRSSTSWNRGAVRWRPAANSSTRLLSPEF